MDVFWIVFLVAIGACVGSFLNVVIWRLPRGESIVFPGSHCPACGRGIRWYDNIPILSWLVLRARCRFCKERISPRYILVEAAAAVLVAGLYLCYFVFGVRGGAGAFASAWPTFVAHAALLCGLLACALVDVDTWEVPLEVCWFVSLAGLAAATAAPHPRLMPHVSAATGGMSLAAALGVAAALLLQRHGLLLPSFVDADYRPGRGGAASEGHPPADGCPADPAAPAAAAAAQARQPAPNVHAVTAEHGVNPRAEVFREVLFLAPAILLAVAAHAVLTGPGTVASAWRRLNDPAAVGAFARHFGGFQASLFGFLVAGATVWGTRILGTLLFGKEAMGLGDMHLLAAVGAAAGWAVPAIAFLLAPLLALLWGLYVLLCHNERELPFGPWLAMASLAGLVFYDPIARCLRVYLIRS